MLLEDAPNFSVLWKKWYPWIQELLWKKKDFKMTKCDPNMYLSWSHVTSLKKMSQHIKIRFHIQSQITRFFWKTVKSSNPGPLFLNGSNQLTLSAATRLNSPFPGAINHKAKFFFPFWIKNIFFYILFVLYACTIVL